MYSKILVSLDGSTVAEQVREAVWRVGVVVLHRGIPRSCHGPAVSIWCFFAAILSNRFRERDKIFFALTSYLRTQHPRTALSRKGVALLEFFFRAPRALFLLYFVFRNIRFSK
jgi:hypothetical protein